MEPWQWLLPSGIALLAIAAHLRRRILIRLMEWSLWVWVLRDVIPSIRFSLHSTKMTGRQYRVGYSLLQPGDIILSRNDRALTTICIPGYWSHALLCVGRIDRGDAYEIAEMVGTGFVKSDFFDTCHQADHVIILRCPEWDLDYARDVIARCMSYDGLPYDFKFAFGVRALYCSELIYQADFEHRLKLTTADMMGLGIVEYVSAQDIREAGNVDVVWDSDQKATAAGSEI